ncbi:uncharacterized protein LOC113788817 [Dermatophagoides pteronyssinus]|uniref:uncharacterized protein LOC113788817 n=1 Tax=Dermatophagoides pteronyssinus TaxID=6956 RepID=UPI003F67C653
MMAISTKMSMKLLTIFTLMIFQSNRFIDCRSTDEDSDGQDRKPPGWLIHNKNYDINEQFMSKNFGQLEFDRRTGQHPPKGSIVSCSIDCFEQTDCHCIEINKQNGQCRFLGRNDLQPKFDENNQTNFLYFTRDYLDGRNHNRIDMTKKAKRTVSESNIQYEFKKSIYMTGFSFQQTKRSSSSLIPFEIRVHNNEPLKRNDRKSTGNKNKKQDVSNADVTNVVDDNGNLCYRYDYGSSLTTLDYQSLGKKSTSTTNRKWIRCQPCGLSGRFITLSASNGTKTNKNNDNWPLESLRIYGYFME